ncbi:iron transport multicopper oxidase FET3 [Xylariales sp. PMI_506]|nr:iron transport multicopper oxidase FET3 [Xylariales sp. PMI_506]
MGFSSVLSWGVLLLSSAARLAAAETHVFDWNITWVLANPDGAHWRPVVGINNQWPLPVLNLTKGDRVVANVHNALGNETTSVHWHGLFQNGTNYMDGPPMVTQCEIPIGGSVTYNFTLDQAGSYWYHSHTRGQYPEGFRQALIIQDPDNPYAGQYDEERVITLSDWYHDQFRELLKTFIYYTNPTGAEPVPNAALMNDTTDFTLDVEPGKTYLIHFINVGAFASQYLWIENHTMQIVEVDGVWTEPADADMIYISGAQRYTVLVTMKNDTTANYPIVASMDTDLFDSIPDGLNWNSTGYLVYDAANENPDAADVDSFDYYDDFNLVPVDGEELLPEADYTITLDLTMDNLGDGANYAFFNGITYNSPKVPTMFTALSAGEYATDPTVYGDYTNSYVLGHNEIIDIVLNNDDTGKHPFHLHGHQFQVIYRSDDNDGHWDPSSESVFPTVPARRDTLIVPPQGNFVIRFKADNPGIWLFHCHIEWHMDAGLASTMIEAPIQMQQNLTVPQDFLDLCSADGVATAGNAAGNTDDYLDLTGENAQIAPLPAGFTTKGYIAMAFSCLAGFLGIVSIAWYGAAPIRSVPQ